MSVYKPGDKRHKIHEETSNYFSTQSCGLQLTAVETFILFY